MTGNNAALPCNKGEAVNSESKDEKITTKGKHTLIIFAILYIIDWYTFCNYLKYHHLYYVIA